MGLSGTVPQQKEHCSTTEMGGWEGEIEGTVQPDYLDIEPGGLEEEVRNTDQLKLTEGKEIEESTFTLQKNEAYAINFSLPSSDDYYY